MNSSGHAIAVWSIQDGITSIWANRFDGTSWGTAELIETETGEASSPQVGVDSSGNAIAVWQQNDGSVDNIMANRFDGMAWGSDAVLIETDTGGAYEPQVAIDSSGHAIAVWAQSADNVYSIFANHFDGTIWGIAEKIEESTSGASDPQIAFDNDGNAIAVWYQSVGTFYNINANRFNGTGWGDAEQIETNADVGNIDPQVTFDSNGNAIAVWRQTDFNAGINSIWANRFK
jgi:hypothetical protein